MEASQLSEKDKVFASMLHAMSPPSLRDQLEATAARLRPDALEVVCSDGTTVRYPDAKAAGKAEVVLAILLQRGVIVDESARDRIRRTADAATLHQWLERCVDAVDARELPGLTVEEPQPRGETIADTIGRRASDYGNRPRTPNLIRDKWFVIGMTDALIVVLRAREVEVSPESDEQIRGAEEKGVVDAWVARCLEARTVEELIGGKAEGKAERKAKGRAEGRAEGKAEALLALLRRRGFAVDRATEQRVLGTTDIALLDGWLDRVLDAKRIEDVLGAGQEA